MAEALVQTVGLKRRHANILVSGSGGSNRSEMKGRVFTKVQPHFLDQNSLHLDAFILLRITSSTDLCSFVGSVEGLEVG